MFAYPVVMSGYASELMVGSETKAMNHRGE